MPKYRLLYEEQNGDGRYIDVESNSLAHAIWITASTLTMDNMRLYSLVDTMSLPDKSNSYNTPVHVNLYPNWTKEDG